MSNRLQNLWRSFGLKVINGLANTSDYEISTAAFGPGPRQQLDWYRVAEPRLTVLFFYGGSWTFGQRQDFRFVADTLCSFGCDVVIPDYRLYPHHRFDDIQADAVAAGNHVIEHVGDSPLVLMGHSAGAQLAALLTLNKSLLTDPTRIDAFVGIAGAYDFFPFSWDEHWDLFAPEEAYPLSQPVNFVRHDAAPLYLLHGAEDRTLRRGQSKSLMEKQNEAGGVAAREVYEGMGHIDAVLSFSRIHRRNSKLIGDIKAYLENL